MPKHGAVVTVPSALTMGIEQGSLESLASEWDGLVDPARPGAPFQFFGWIAPWWSHFGARRRLLVLTARDQGGRLIGLLPLYAQASVWSGPSLRLLGDGIVGSDHLGVIARPQDRGRVARIFAAHLSTRREAWFLDGVAEDDPLTEALESVSGRPILSRQICPLLSLPRDFERYLDALPQGTGAQWRRRRRWLERRAARTELLRTEEEVARGLTVLFALHRARWACEGGSDAIDSLRVERFHLEAGRRLAGQGIARVYLLHVEGAPRAALYGFRCGQRFSFYQSGLDPEWRQRSVGTVLLGEVLRDCVAEGAAELDFLRGTEGYKLLWADGARRTGLVTRPAPGLRGETRAAVQVGWGSLRRALVGALPLEAVERLRQERRRAAAWLGGRR